MTTPHRPYDIYKDTPIRLLGYANEVGEALRGFIGYKLVRASYGIATLYVIADTVDKTGKALIRNKGTDRIKKSIFAASDTLIWQMLASVIIPGYTINRVCALTDSLLMKNSKITKLNRQIYVTAVGLAVIPFIIKPIDHFVDFLLDMTLRKVAPYGGEK